MHIREPRDFEEVRSKRRLHYRLKKVRHLLLVSFIIVLGLCLVAYGAYLRPLPGLTAKTISMSVPVGQVALSWPASGQAAIGVAGQGVMANTANQQAVPTASVAKVMMALAVLKKHPLNPGESGPTLTMTSDDVDRFNYYVGQDGSVVRVVAGEQISELQALQAALLPSANNMADSLAVWAYGSMDAYHTAANQLAASLGMIQSTFAGDASGFLPETKSTPHDLVLLGQAAFQNAALKAIVGQDSADIPLVGTVNNTNAFLGVDGIVGIKTGNTDQAGGCYMFAATRQVGNGQPVTVIGAIQGATSLGRAMTGAQALLNSFYQNFTTSVVVPKGTVVGHYDVPWDHSQLAIVSAQDTNVFNWRGSKITVKIQPQTLRGTAKAGDAVGNLVASSNYQQTTTPLTLTGTLTSPNWQWRIWHR